MPPTNSGVFFLKRIRSITHLLVATNLAALYSSLRDKILTIIVLHRRFGQTFVFGNISITTKSSFVPTFVPCNSGNERFFLRILFSLLKHTLSRIRSTGTAPKSSLIKDALSSGMDGALLLGCKYGDDYQCHFVKGSEIATKRMENIGETLGSLGLEPERCRAEQVAITDFNKVPDLIQEFVEEIIEMGPNPFKGF